MDSVSLSVAIGPLAIYDLLSTHKPIGKSLKGKSTFLISTGTDPELPEGFEIPFKLTSEYFEMRYQKAFYLAVK
jgi:hypothetical protein